MELRIIEKGIELLLELLEQVVSDKLDFHILIQLLVKLILDEEVTG
jgi:hypothetical protein